MNALNRSTKDCWLIGIAVLFPTLVTWIYFVALRNESDSIQKVAYGIGKTIQFGFPIVWVWCCYRSDIGHRKPQRGELITGLISGIAIAVTMWLLFDLVISKSAVMELLQQRVQEKIAELGLDSAGMYVGTAIFYAAFHSLMEEYYWRWFVFGQLKKKTNLSTAIAISSLGFMAHHVLLLAIYLGWSSPLTYAFSLCIAIGGAGWAWMYHRFGTLYGAWLSHAIVDAGIFWVGYQMVEKML